MTLQIPSGGFIQFLHIPSPYSASMHALLEKICQIALYALCIHSKSPCNPNHIDSNISSNITVLSRAIFQYVGLRRGPQAATVWKMI